MITGISVVIPNYNGIKLFPHTLPTVVEVLENTELPSEIIIVDDCSTDESVKYLQENYPGIKLLVNEQNAGFSVTSNKGIRAATYNHVLLLNSDVKLTKGYFDKQLKYFDKPDTFGVMGRIIGWHDEIIQDGAKFPSFHGSKIKTSGNYLLKHEEDMQEGLYSMYLSGANAFMDKEKCLQIGGFNELFSPFYVEDVELSLRAWRLGFKCYYDYSSVCRHQVSTSIKSKSKKQYVNTIYNRNKMFLHALHLEGTSKAMWYLQLLPEALARLFTLRWHYFKSLSMFFGASAEVEKSQAEFDQLAKKLGHRLTVGEVKELILESLPADIVRM